MASQKISQPVIGIVWTLDVHTSHDFVHERGVSYRVKCLTTEVDGDNNDVRM